MKSNYRSYQDIKTENLLNDIFGNKPDYEPNFAENQFCIYMCNCLLRYNSNKTIILSLWEVGFLKSILTQINTKITYNQLRKVESIYYANVNETY